jgi:hypothetical protein
MPFDVDRIYELLPAVYRVRDAQPDGSNGPVHGLLDAVAREVVVLEDSLAQLYDDQFIETCSKWVVPYIADLLGVQGVYQLGGDAPSARAFVAKTIHYRRRKGTAAGLEELAGGVTDWPAVVVEFFDLLAWTQYMHHIRPGKGGTVELRSAGALARIGGPFDSAAHTADVRRVESRRGRYNLPNVGIFLWRLKPRRHAHIRPVQVDGDGRRFRLSPLGIDVPLFAQPLTGLLSEGATTDAEAVTGVAAGAAAGRVTPLNVPAPVSRRLLEEARVARGQVMAGATAETVDIRVGGADLPSGAISVCDLSDVTDASGKVTWAHVAQLPAGTAALDPVLGRLAFADKRAPNELAVTYSTGFAADLGGGDYPRSLSKPLSVADATRGPDEPPADVRTIDVPGEATTIQAAIGELVRKAEDGIVVVTGNGTYAETIAIDAPHRWLEVRAEDKSNPVIQLNGDLHVRGDGATVRFDGFLITGGGIRVDNSVDRFVLRHCTVVPGHSLRPDGTPNDPGMPSIVVEPRPDHATDVVIDHSIVGPVSAPYERAEVTVTDSIVDGAVPSTRGSRTDALVSADLTSFPALGANPVLSVTLGVGEAATISLGGAPSDIGDAAAKLEAALRSARPTPTFTAARVLAVEARLVVIPGIPARPVFANVGADSTATELGLVEGARRVVAAVGRPLSPPLTLSAAAPEVCVVLGSAGPVVVPVSDAAADADAVAAAMQASLRAASADALFTAAIVMSFDGALLLLPGTDGAAASVLPTTADMTTAVELELVTPPFVIAADLGGAEPGPRASLERSTVIGGTSVRELSLASDSIFLGPVRCLRLQTGCVRFSYVAPGSRTPRRYRCQPDDADPGVEPLFTSLAFGDAAYCQLSRACPGEIWRGATDESEMGAFHDVFEPQRETNLCVALDEYLRFAAEAGIFYAT